MMRKVLTPAVAGFLALITLPALAQDKVVNLYTGRHYQTDEKLYEGFTKATGIKINRIEGSEDEIIERIRNEGANSPADVLITVDVGRLWRAQQAGLFGQVKSPGLEARIPANLRDPNGEWFGFSTRARVLVYAKDKVKPAEVARYEDLAAPTMKGRICARSGGHVYNLALLASIIAADGESKAEAWAKSVAGNLARAPKGGDTDQIRAVGAGECDVAISNTYYFVRLMNSTKPEDKELVAKLAVSFPNQADRGTHVNISGGGMVKTAPNKENARRLLEYLASDEAQKYFSDGNNEWPAAEVKTENKALNSLGTFKVDHVNVGTLGRNQPTAQAIYNRAGWK
jgi:iron(III) transport system substrate-binding protein